MAARMRSLTGTVIVAGWATIGWLPVVGLMRLLIGGTHEAPASKGGPLETIAEHARQIGEPPIVQVVC